MYLYNTAVGGHDKNYDVCFKGLFRDQKLLFNAHLDEEWISSQVIINTKGTFLFTPVRYLRTYI